MTAATKTCPRCAMEVPAAAHVCGHCRKTLRTSPVTWGCLALICTVALLCMLPLFLAPTGQTSRRPAGDQASCNAFWSVVNSPQTRAAGMVRTEKIADTNQIVLWWDDRLWAGAEYQQKEQIVNALGAEWKRCGGSLLYVRGLRSGSELAKYSVWGVTIR